jgi:Zn-dependent peptidase ImmA (M78 family)
MLRWARATAGMSIDDVVAKLARKRVTAETVAAWERGEQAPDYGQLERLAYEVYRRPLAMFFFPQPPVEDTPRQEFRTLPETEIARLSPRMRFLVRRAAAMQANLEELFAEAEPSARQLLTDIAPARNESAATLAKRVRQYLDIDLEEQFRWKDAETAFKRWRQAFQDAGVFVFKDAFKDEEVAVFCLYDTDFPVIYVNNSRPATNQIFTLFHELCHLLFRTGGIDTADDRYIDELTGRNKEIEVLCNRFAGAFLVPEDDFDRRTRGVPVNEENIGKWAETYSVSREVVLRRLADQGRVTGQVYQQYVTRWRQGAKGRGGSGGDYYLTKGVYLGEKYLERAFSRYYQRRITVDQLAGYLGVKVGKVPGMEALLFPKGRQP